MIDVRLYLVAGALLVWQPDQSVAESASLLLAAQTVPMKECISAHGCDQSGVKCNDRCKTDNRYNDFNLAECATRCRFLMTYCQQTAQKQCLEPSGGESSPAPKP